jgi:hypothetical protein
MKRDRRPIHHSPIFWIGIALCLAAIAIYLWSDDLAWRPAPPHDRGSASASTGLRPFSSSGTSPFHEYASII